MRIFIISALLTAICISTTSAQDVSDPSHETKTIEINNDNGELYISFRNGEITKFTVNDEAIPEEIYNSYQDIIDDFSGEETLPSPPALPPPPEFGEEQSQSAILFEEIIEYLEDVTDFNPNKKYKIELKQEYLKVNGNILDDKLHQACVNIFEDIYDETMNDKIVVKFKKKRSNYSISVQIRD